LKKLKLENNMKKSDENDAVILSKISRDGFRPLTIQEMKKKVELRPLIDRYELLLKRIKTLKTLTKRDGYNYELKDSVLDKAAKTVDNLPKEKAIYRLGLMILKALRKAYLSTINPTGR